LFLQKKGVSIKRIATCVMLIIMISNTGCSSKSAPVQETANSIPTPATTTTQNTSNQQNNTNQTTYQIYRNDRYGFLMEYPSDFVAQTPPVNGDGLKFDSKDGRAELIGSGINNVGSPEPEPINTYIGYTLDDAQGGTIKYQHIEKTWFVISWEKDGIIYYNKTFWGTGSTNAMNFRYPADQADFYNSICADISNTFQHGDLSESH